MPRVISDKTLLREAKAIITRLVPERNAAQETAEAYRKRATKAEQECAEWKVRFDALLNRDKTP